MARSGGTREASSQESWRRSYEASVLVHGNAGAVRGCECEDDVVHSAGELPRRLEPRSDAVDAAGRQRDLARRRDELEAGQAARGQSIAVRPVVEVDHLERVGVLDTVAMCLAVESVAVADDIENVRSAHQQRVAERAERHADERRVDDETCTHDAPRLALQGVPGGIA